MADLTDAFGDPGRKLVEANGSPIKKDLQNSLFANGYDRQSKTLFIWEGVTMYVDSDAVDQTLSFIVKNVGNRSSLIFDYTYPEVLAGTFERKEAKEWLRIAQKSDEPLLFGIRQDNIESSLRTGDFSMLLVYPPSISTPSISQA